MSTVADELCRALGLETPVFQAGMGYVSHGRLAAAVCAAGGLGVIATGGEMSPAELRHHIEHVRDEAPGAPFGVNVLLPSGATDDAVYGSPAVIRAQLDTCFAERVPLIVSGLGDPRPRLPEIHAHGIRFVAVVGSLRAARNVASAGADAVVVQGSEAGGHVGPTGTFSLAQCAVRELDVPVLVAGGIATAESVKAALGFGAAGVSVGTRFLASEESSAHARHKQAVVQASENGTAVTRACSGKSSRALRSPFVEAWLDRDAAVQPYPEQATQHFWRARAGCIEGDWEEGFFPAGQCSAAIDAVLPAKQIVEDLSSLVVAA